MNEEIIRKLDAISTGLNGIAGRLIVTAMRVPEVADAHRMALELGAYVNDLINELMGEDEP